MTLKLINLSPKLPDPIYVKTVNLADLGFGYRLSEEARRDIEAIEWNARTSLARSAHIVFD